MNEIDAIFLEYISDLWHEDQISPEQAENFIYDRIPVMTLGGLWNDLVQTCINNANWEEIARCYNEQENY